MARFKRTTINDTGFLQLPAGTTSQRPGQPGQPAAAPGMIRYNTTNRITEWYDDEYQTWFPTGVIPPIATGGTITDITEGGITYRVHTFTSVGSSDFVVTRGGQVEYLLVAGGGAGGNSRASLGGGGGGGGGGVLIGVVNVTPQTYGVTVGGGGAAPTANTDSVGKNGGNSSFASFTAFGGGYGGNGSFYLDGFGGRGGSGGGGGYRPYTTQNSWGEAIPGHGCRGGGVDGTSASGGGGGGAGGPGYRNTGTSGGRGGDGGPGIYSSISGSLIEYGRGGQGGSGSSNTPANRGTGGRGAYAAAGTYSGGSGIVILRYRTS